MRTRLAFFLGLLIGIGGLTARAIAQIEPTTSDRFERRLLELFEKEDYRAAADLLEKQLEKTPNDLGVLYNAACAYARLGEFDTAAEYLFRSVEAGFIDFDHIIRDPDLDGLREHPKYLDIISIRDRAYEGVAERQLDAARKTFGDEGYRYETDNDRRLNYATALDEVSYQEMRRMLELQADHLCKMFFERPPDRFNLIAVPTPADYHRLISNPKIGGLYEQPKHRLLARDTGIMLRHEFVHLMHWGHMTRLRQAHALWIQEGLAALYETYRASPNGGIRFLPNVRHNFVKQMVANHEQIPWRDLFGMSPDAFMDDARHTYPMVRSIFRFINSRGKLREWYQNYTASYGEDRNGVLAFERTFNVPLETVERRWRSWIRVQPMVDDLVIAGDASLGVLFVEDAVNDGVLIEAVLHDSAAQRAGIEPGDIIVSVDGQPIRSHIELRYAIGSKRVGDRVPVRVRRNGQYLIITVTLAPLRAMLDSAPPPAFG